MEGREKLVKSDSTPTLKTPSAEDRLDNELHKSNCQLASIERSQQGFKS